MDSPEGLCWIQYKKSFSYSYAPTAFTTTGILLLPTSYLLATSLFGILNKSTTILMNDKLQ